MIKNMDEFHSQAFSERIVATTIANQAAIKCQASGLPLTVDNVIMFVGDFVDPNNRDFESLIRKIENAILEVAEVPHVKSPPRCSG